MRYYFCAYGHQIRWSEKTTSPEEAAKYCFGTAQRVTCLDVGTRSPKYFQHKKVQELHQELAKQHKEKTGNDIAF